MPTHARTHTHTQMWWALVTTAYYVTKTLTLRKVTAMKVPQQQQQQQHTGLSWSGKEESVVGSCQSQGETLDSQLAYWGKVVRLTTWTATESSRLWQKTDHTFETQRSCVYSSLWCRETDPTFERQMSCVSWVDSLEDSKADQCVKWPIAPYIKQLQRLASGAESRYNPSAVNKMTHLTSNRVMNWDSLQTSRNLLTLWFPLHYRTNECMYVWFLLMCFSLQCDSFGPNFTMICLALGIMVSHLSPLPNN